MRCSEIMKMDVECVSPETSVRDAARRMKDRGVGFLPVCDEERRPVGTITDRDIAVRAVAEDLALHTPVEECMTREVVNCLSAADIEETHDLMARHQVSRIICTDNYGRVEGIISLSDIVDVDQESGARTLRDVSQRETHSGAKGKSRRLEAGL